jgi:hypothetical protein
MDLCGLRANHSVDILDIAKHQLYDAASDRLNDQGDAVRRKREMQTPKRTHPLL